MNPKDFSERSAGRLVQNLEGNLAFAPNLLPPKVAWLPTVLAGLNDATWQMGRLDGTLVAHDGISPGLLLRPLLQREATLSSRIEGTVTDESQLALFEVREKTEEGVPDVREVSNYLRALEWGVEIVRQRGITVTLIRQLHERLMHGVRGGDQNPGQFRDCQVYLGAGGRGIASAKFVPPPYAEVPHLIENLVHFIREDRTLPPLIRAAIAHYQFETIHPFRDGNGRVGRLLIALQVLSDLDMQVPALHMSPFFERNRRPYYDGLLDVSQLGDWPGWVGYFLSGIAEQARDVMTRLTKLRDLRNSYRERFGNMTGSLIMYRLIDLLFKKPAVDIATVASELSITRPPAAKHLRRLMDGNVLREMTGMERDRVFLAEEIMKIVQED